MPLATNALLQANATATARSGSATHAAKPADGSKDGASSFSNVYAKQAKDAVSARDDVPVKSARDKTSSGSTRSRAARTSLPPIRALPRIRRLLPIAATVCLPA